MDVSCRPPSFDSHPGPAMASVFVEKNPDPTALPGPTLSALLGGVARPIIPRGAAAAAQPQPQHGPRSVPSAFKPAAGAGPAPAASAGTAADASAVSAGAAAAAARPPPAAGLAATSAAGAGSAAASGAAMADTALSALRALAAAAVAKGRASNGVGEGAGGAAGVSGAEEDVGDGDDERGGSASWVFGVAKELGVRESLLADPEVLRRAAGRLKAILEEGGRG